MQATKNIWHQESILRVAARNQPTERLVKIQLAKKHMSLLDGLSLGKHVVVGFLVRGEDCYWESAPEYLVVLMGQQLVISLKLDQRKKSSERCAAPNVATTGFSAHPTQVAFPQSRAFRDESPF